MANKVKWTKGYDFCDNSPRYTFYERDPQTSCEDITVVIYTRKEREFEHDSKSIKNFYYGCVTHESSETSDETGKLGSLKEAKIMTEELYRKYNDLFNK